MILLECEDKGAYATIVTVGCGGYCWRVKKKVCSYSRVWRILLEGEEKGAYANIVTVGCGDIVGG